MSAALVLSLHAGAIGAGPLTADRLPPALLAACDAQAEPYGRYAPAIAEAAAALIDIGAVTRADFDGARIGFCAMQGAGGPAAATTCEDGIILLDEKFAAAGQALNLRATLAHELTHHRQHQFGKARDGASYCRSARYAADRPAFESEADAVGEQTAALFMRGRGVEIINRCDAPVSIYIEAEQPAAARGPAAAFEQIPPRKSVISAERSLSGRFLFYARTAAATGPTHVWQDARSAQSRIVEGRPVRLRAISLAAPDRVNSPFRLRLSCPAGG